MDIGQVVMKLSRMGYRFELQGEKVRYEWQGNEDPDPSAVSPLLDLVRQHKDDVRYFLKSYCPRCGGCCFIPVGNESLCMACDWEQLKEIYPDLKVKN